MSIHSRCQSITALTGDTRKIFVSNICVNKTVDKSNSARVLVGCKPTIIAQLSGASRRFSGASCRG